MNDAKFNLTISLVNCFKGASNKEWIDSLDVCSQLLKTFSIRSEKITDNNSKVELLSDIEDLVYASLSYKKFKIDYWLVQVALNLYYSVIEGVHTFDISSAIGFLIRCSKIREADLNKQNTSKDFAILKSHIQSESVNFADWANKVSKNLKKIILTANSENFGEEKELIEFTNAIKDNLSNLSKAYDMVIQKESLFIMVKEIILRLDRHKTENPIDDVIKISYMSIVWLIATYKGYKNW